MSNLVMKNPKASIKIATPMGRFLWLALKEPRPETAAMQANKYTCTVAWDKDSDEVKEASKAFIEAVVKVAREAYNNPNLKFGEFPQSVVKDGDASEKNYLQNMWYCSSSTGAKFPPKIYGPVLKLGELPLEEVEKISQGDYGRMVVTISAYKTPAMHGITSYLSIAQFAKKGEYLGNISGLDCLGDVEVNLDDVKEVTEENKKATSDSDDFFEF